MSAEKLRVMLPPASLGVLEAARLDAWCDAYDIPTSTMRAIIRLGHGPRTFPIGRLLFVLRTDWSIWLDTLAQRGGTGPLSPPAGRFGRKA